MNHTRDTVYSFLHELNDARENGYYAYEYKKTTFKLVGNFSFINLFLTHYSSERVTT